MCVHLESVLELNFLHKQPLRSLCVTLDGGLTSKVCGAEGQPLFTQEKRVFWVELRWRRPEPDHSSSPSHVLSCCRGLIYHQFSTCVVNTHGSAEPLQHHDCHVTTTARSSLSSLFCLVCPPHSLFIFFVSSYL